MKILRILIVAVMAAGLAGCVKNEAEFEALRIAVKKRPDVQAQGLSQCERRVKYFDIEVKRYIAGYAHLKVDKKFPGTFCQRLLTSYVNGRMKWADYEAIRGGNRQRVTPNLTRIMRGG